jgi:hypothetical protein
MGQVRFHSRVDDDALAAVTFFAVSVFAELVGIVLYAFVFPKLQTVKEFRISAQQQGALTVKEDLAAAGLQTEHSVRIIPSLQVPHNPIFASCTKTLIGVGRMTKSANLRRA